MQYAIYPNPSAKSRDEYPYLVDIQSDLLSGLSTRLVAPLAPFTGGNTAIPQRLCPSILVTGTQYTVLAHLAAPVLKAHLKHPVDNASSHAHAIVAALDAVLSGL